MIFDIFITIIITSILQSIFGVGVLLFGTPILLMIGYEFQFVLSILLPISILINTLQLKDNYRVIDFKFYKNFLICSIPFTMVSLFIISSNQVNINFYIGGILVFISLKSILKVFKRIFSFFLRHERKYLVILGILHGISNLGGALLSAAVLNRNMNKESKRATIAICYLSLAVFQVITLILANRGTIFINNTNFIYWLPGFFIYYITNRNLFLKINEQQFKKYSSIFLLIIGLCLLFKFL